MTQYKYFALALALIGGVAAATFLISMTAAYLRNRRRDGHAIALGRWEEEGGKLPEHDAKHFDRHWKRDGR